MQEAMRDLVIMLYQLMVKEQLDHLSNENKYLLFYLAKKPMGVIDKGTFTLESLDFIKYRIKEIANYELREIIQQLINEGWLIKVNPQEFNLEEDIELITTLHADIVFRVLHSRAYPHKTPWAGEKRIKVEIEPIPDFNAIKLDALAKIIHKELERNGINSTLAQKVSKAIIKGLEKSGYSGLASWQYNAIRRILQEKYTVYIISTPTASGKTLAFTIPLLVHTIIRKIKERKKSTKAILVYPRIALENQQLEEYLRILANINNELKKLDENLVLTVAVDKGVSLEREEKREMPLELECPYHKGKELRIVYERRSYVVYCEKGHSLDFFYGIAMTRRLRRYILEREPDILITNPWAISSRLVDPRKELRNAYSKASYVVFDEAHVYINTNNEHLISALHVLRHHLSKRKSSENIKFIISSATIYLDDKRDLAEWLLGVDKESAYEIEYTPESRKRRLKILVTLLPLGGKHETLVQGIAMVLLLLALSRRLKTILFSDSISEISTLYGYLVTILKNRNAVELGDHILNGRCRVEDWYSTRTFTDDYSWWPLVSNIYRAGEYNSKKLCSDLSNLIDVIAIHHGGLEPSERRKIEKEFQKGNKRFLLATSTMDLGIDIKDVAFIIQYKIPLSGEALEQRLGRAGRSDDVMRISLGFFIPQVTPITLETILRGNIISTRTLPDKLPLISKHMSYVLVYHLIKKGKAKIILRSQNVNAMLSNLFTQIRNALTDPVKRGELFKDIMDVGIVRDKQLLERLLQRMEYIVSPISLHSVTEKKKLSLWDCIVSLGFAASRIKRCFGDTRDKDAIKVLEALKEVENKLYKGLGKLKNALTGGFWIELAEQLNNEIERINKDLQYCIDILDGQLSFLKESIKRYESLRAGGKIHFSGLIIESLKKAEKALSDAKNKLQEVHNELNKELGNIAPKRRDLLRIIRLIIHLVGIKLSKMRETKGRSPVYAWYSMVLPKFIQLLQLFEIPSTPIGISSSPSRIKLEVIEL